MKKNQIQLILAVAVVAMVAFTAPADAQRRASAQVGANCTGGFQAVFDEIEAVPLSAAEIDEVLYLREEEKLARDVYLTLAERWQLPIFANIASAEQRHMDLVLQVIEIYGLEDSITDDTVGAFNDPELDDLFSTLTASGDLSLVDALTVGATIEDLDLADLYELFDLTDNDHLQMVAYNLAKGSRNHLRAFVRALGAQEADYEPVYLTGDEYDAILESGVERRVFFNADGEPLPACGADAGGFGMRRGPGHGGGNGSGNGECDGTGTGDCDGNGSSNGGRRGGSGNGSGSGSGTCDGTGSGSGN